MSKHDALALDVTRLQAVHAPPPINGAKMMRVAVAARGTHGHAQIRSLTLSAHADLTTGGRENSLLPWS